MYIQTTTRCNMLCAHCCFAATNKGQDMDHEVFLAALHMAERMGEVITIGGGEPTCHKHIIDFVKRAMDSYLRDKLEMAPLIITNGKLKGKANQLLDLAEREGSALYVELSQDEWHDPIDPQVVHRFNLLARRKFDANFGFNRSQDYSNVGIRTVENIGPWGRAADPARGITIGKHMSPCTCDDLFIGPDGTVYSCGCKHIKLGSVLDSDLDLSWYEKDYGHTGGVELITVRAA